MSNKYKKNISGILEMTGLREAPTIRSKKHGYFVYNIKTEDPSHCTLNTIKNLSAMNISKFVELYSELIQYLNEWITGR